MIEQYVADIVPENDTITLKKSEADQLIYEITKLKELMAELIEEVERDHRVFLVNKQYRRKYLKAKQYLGM
jgi:hypothetical protein